MTIHQWLMCVALVLAAMPVYAQSADVQAIEAKQKAYADRALKALAAETAREKHGDCANAQNTIDSNACLTREMAITDANYKSFVLGLGGLLRLSTDENEVKAAPDVGRRFDAAEALWSSYRKAACDTVYQHYIQGTIRGIAYGNCMQTIARSHMHELATVYDEALH